MRSALADLAEAALIEDAADDERTSARPRALRPPAALLRRPRRPGDAGLGVPPPHHPARVALLGVGGLGDWAAYALACCGVGELVLVDGDVVEESNFNRQILYRERDIGRPKTEAAAEALAEFDSACRLTRCRAGSTAWSRSASRSRAPTSS